MSKLTTTHKISIFSVIAVLIVGIGGWYFGRTSSQPDEPLVHQEANQNSSSIVTQVANVNQVAEFTLQNKEVLFQDNEHQAALTFKLNGEIPPMKICLNVEADAQILDLNVQGSYDITRKDVGAGTICITKPEAEILLWVKFDKKPARLDGSVTNL